VSITDNEGRTAEDRAALEAQHGRMWRWKIDRPTRDVLDRTIHNLERAGFELRQHRGLSTMPEWCKPGGGAVYPVFIDDDGAEYLSHHAIDSFGHWLPDCPKCGTPVEANNPQPDGWCFTCNHWRRIIAERHLRIILERSEGTRSCLTDGGPKSTRDTSCLGFGGMEWKLVNVVTGAPLTTNNMWHQGEVPERFWDELPITHRLES